MFCQTPIAASVPCTNHHPCLPPPTSFVNYLLKFTAAMHASINVLYMALLLAEATCQRHGTAPTPADTTLCNAYSIFTSINLRNHVAQAPSYYHPMLLNPPAGKCRRRKAAAAAAAAGCVGSQPGLSAGRRGRARR